MIDTESDGVKRKVVNSKNEIVDYEETFMGLYDFVIIKLNLLVMLVKVDTFEAENSELDLFKDLILSGNVYVIQIVGRTFR